MKGKRILEGKSVSQGIYLPETDEEVRELVNKASEMAPLVARDISNGFLAPALEAAQSEKDRVIRHFAHMVALGALASTHLSFQSKPVQDAIHSLVHQHTAALRAFFFENGARDADVLFEKMQAETEEAKS